MSHLRKLYWSWKSDWILIMALMGDTALWKFSLHNYTHYLTASVQLRVRLHRVSSVNAVMALAILLLMKTVESLQNGFVALSGGTPLFSIIEVSLASAQHCCCVETYGWFTLPETDLDTDTDLDSCPTHKCKVGIRVPVCAMWICTTQCNVTVRFGVRIQDWNPSPSPAM